MSKRFTAFLLRGAGWLLSLLLLLSVGPAARGNLPAGPPTRDATPSAAVDALLQRPPAPAPEPTVEPTPEPTPASTSTPAPSPTAVPTATPSLAPSPVPSPVATATVAPAPTPTPPPIPSPLVVAAAPTQTPSADAGTATEILSLTNDLRASNGLPPLISNPALTAAAADYARRLALSNWFSHQGPAGSTLASRAEAAGYTDWLYLAENIYRGPYDQPAPSIVELWADSQPHRSAMLSAEATEIGVGCHVSGDSRWCVQVLGAR